MISIVTSKPSVADMKELWSLCFPGEERYKDFFFAKLRDKNASMLAKISGKSVGMLHMLPQTFVSPEGKHLAARYLYAICTHPNYRGRGIAKTLVERALEMMWRRGEAVATLVPGNRRLFDYYAQLGFQPCFAQSVAERGERPLAREVAIYRDVPRLRQMYDRAMAGYVHVLRDEVWWRLLLDECKVTGGKVLFSDHDYAVLDSKGNVRECLSHCGAEHSYGAARIVDVGKVRRWAGISATMGDETLVSRIFGGAYMNLMHD
ncbi:MAG: GNAT family N-acetyltransferase [Oscillospiraceae bacterium]|nr:GNAT family N-acetyltransferase [Oscillospiraceae bacterium]